MATVIPSSKGTILRSLLKFIEADLTPAQRQAALSALSPEDLAMAQSRVLPSSHVPEVMLNRLTVAAAKAKGEDLQSFGVRAGLAELSDSIGMYRFLIIVLTPPAVLGKVSSAWPSVHNTGSFIVLEQSPTHARLQLKDFASEAAHCARLTGWIQGLAEMTKVKNVRIKHDRCMTRGAGDCQWEIRWDA